jgi:hypothetical protein
MLARTEPMMRRSASILLPLLLLAGCDDEPETPEDPPLAVPEHEVPEAPQPPPGLAGQPMPTAMASGGEPREWDPALAVPGYETLPDPPPPPMPPGMQPGQAPPGMQPGQAPPGMQPGQPPRGAAAGGGPIQLAPGFRPDPVVTRGVAGGPVAAGAMDPQCAGFVGSEPSHVLALAQPFQSLRILVSSEQDTTLVVRGPDGQYRCTDDDEGMNPVLAGAFSPGQYAVWVGSYQQGTQAPYALGLSELPQVTTQQIAQAAQGMQQARQPR